MDFAQHVVRVLPLRSAGGHGALSSSENVQ
jgi:hypothetical protein